MSDSQTGILCAKCGVALTAGAVTFEYLGSQFPVEMLVCPRCGIVFVPEDLAVGKMLQVEKALEDK